jgi:tetratricopeptide (TPR) repeat protein
MARSHVFATLPASHRQRLIKSGIVRDSLLDALFALLEIQRGEQIVERNPKTPVSRGFVPLPFLKLLCFKGDVVFVLISTRVSHLPELLDLVFRQFAHARVADQAVLLRADLLDELVPDRRFGMLPLEKVVRRGRDGTVVHGRKPVARDGTQRLHHAFSARDVQQHEQPQPRHLPAVLAQKDGGRLRRFQRLEWNNHVTKRRSLWAIGQNRARFGDAKGFQSSRIREILAKNDASVNHWAHTHSAQTLFAVGAVRPGDRIGQSPPPTAFSEVFMPVRPGATIAVLALSVLAFAAAAPAAVTPDDSVTPNGNDQVYTERYHVECDFDSAVAWCKDAVSREDFAEAQYAYEKAGDAATQGLNVFSATERQEFENRLADLRKLISQRKVNEMSTPDGAGRLQAAERRWRNALGNDTFETARIKRQRTVADLIKKARGLTDNAQYEEAKRVIKQILALDPRNDYGIGVLPLLDDRVVTFEQRTFRERFDTKRVGIQRFAPEAHLASSADWLIIPLAVVLPVVWGRFRARTRCRVSRGLCLACGYDLRATPRRCPECGMVPAGIRNGCRGP